MLNNSHIKRVDTQRKIVFVERFNRTIGDLLKGPVSKLGKSNWVDEVGKVRRKDTNTNHSSTEMIPIQTSLKSNDKEVFNN